MVLGNQVEGKCSGRNIRLLDIAELTARRATFLMDLDGAQVVWGCRSSNWSVEWVSRFEFGFLLSIVASRNISLVSLPCPVHRSLGAATASRQVAHMQLPLRGITALPQSRRPHHSRTGAVGWGS